MSYGSGRPIHDPARRRIGKTLSLSQSMRDTLALESERREISEGMLAEKWMRLGIAHDPELAHLSAKTGTNHAS